MKKNWNNPELKNLEVKSTNTNGCPMLTDGVSTYALPCLACMTPWGWSYYCEDCKGCKHECYDPNDRCNWPCDHACNCNQGS